MVLSEYNAGVGKGEQRLIPERSIGNLSMQK